MQTKTRNMQTLEQWFSTLNRGDAVQSKEFFRSICTEDYKIHDPGMPEIEPGLTSYMVFFDEYMKGATDIKVVIEDMFETEEKVVTRATLNFLDTATNEKIKMMCIAISQFENGKIKEEWQITAPLAEGSN